MKKMFNVVVFLCSVHMAHALEGLRVLVQPPDVVLSWPSDDSQPNSYAILYRPSLADPWQLLASWYPPDYSTNVTYFTIAGGETNITGLYEVVMMGPNICALTNGQVLSGVVVIPVEAFEPSGNLNTMAVQDSGVPLASTLHVQPFERPVPLLVLDTTQLSPGPHSLSAICQYVDPSAGTEEGTIVYEGVSTPEISVTVSNEITFPDWIPFFGEFANSAVINAQCTTSNSDWYLDVYGDTNRYIGTMSGNTPDGNINIVWDLTGPGNIVQNDSKFSFHLTTYVGGVARATGTPPPIYRVFDPWMPGLGGWVVVNQQAWENVLDHGQLDVEADGFAQTASGLGCVVRPTLNSQSFRIRFGSGDPLGDYDWASFRNALYDLHSRNLFYLGHGGPTAIGYDTTTTNRSISSAELGTNFCTMPPRTNGIPHRWRFVLLDGCSTAAGNLPEAFGIIHREHVLSIDYINASLRPSAFAGWSEDKTARFVNVIYQPHVYFFQHFLQHWSFGEGVKQAFLSAAGSPDVAGLLMTSDLKVFGYWDLGINAYNQ
jgi:hypothetical protein